MTVVELAGATAGERLAGAAVTAPGEGVQILFVARGSCSVRHAEGRRPLWPGAVCIGDTELESSTLDFGGWLLSVDERELCRPELVGLETVPVAAALAPGVFALGPQQRLRCQTFLEALDCERGPGSQHDPQVELGLLHLILLCYASAAGVPQSPMPAAAPPGHKRLADEVLEVIERRFADRLSLASVAAELSRSPASIARTAREVTGRSVVELIAERRMQEARVLLVESDLSVAEIASRVGYRSLGYFHRAFRKSTETTPQRWRVGNSAPTVVSLL